MSDETVSKYTNVVVAKYLEKNGYIDTLSSFLRETRLPLRAISTDSTPSEDLETIIGDRIKFGEQIVAEGLKNLSINNAMADIDTSKYRIPSWNHTARFMKTPFDAGLLIRALTISATFCEPENSLLLSTASKEVMMYDEKLRFVDNLTTAQGTSGIIKLCGSIGNTGYYYLCGVDGSLSLLNGKSKDASHGKWKIHNRMISHIKFLPKDDGSWFVVSCGLDNYLRLSILKIPKEKGLSGLTIDKTSEVKLLSPCTSLQVAFASTEANENPIIFLTRSDYTHIVCYGVDGISHYLEVLFKIALNNAQFSTYSFNVREMCLLSGSDTNGYSRLTEGSTLVVATSHSPYMRLLVVEIPSLPLRDTDERDKSALVAEKIFYDKVLRNITTEVSQDSYSQPIIRVLPNGNGVLVGDSEGLYAIDVEKGDSWSLKLPGIATVGRVKCMDVNQQGSRMVLGLADASVYVWNIVY